MECTSSTQSDVITLDDHDIAWKSDTDIQTCKVLRISAHLNPSDLETPFNILLCKKIGISWPCETNLTGSRGGEDGSRHTTVMVVSTDVESDVQLALTVLPFGPGPRTIYTLRNPGVEHLCIIRLSVNVFALRTIAPMTELLPVRYKPVNENSPKRPRIHLADSCVALNSSPDKIQLRISASELQWRFTDSGLSGPCGLATTITARLPEIENGDPLTFAFGRLLWSSHPGVMIVKIDTFEGALCLHLIHEVDPSTSIPKRLNSIPTPKEISLRVEICNAKIDGPYLSAIGSPYFRTPMGEQCLEVLAPYNFSVYAGMSYNLRVYRKHYGDFVGLFVPTATLRLHVTAVLWNPRTWLDMSIMSTRDEKIYRGETLGRIYFVPHVEGINVSKSCQFTNDVRSKISKSANTCICILGMKYRLQDLPDITLSKAPPNTGMITTLAIETQ